MELKSNFTTAKFGGFKKDEVVAYIDEVVTTYNDEVSELKKDIEDKDKQILELKDIVEQQYQKIVAASDETVQIKDELDTKIKENESAQNELKQKNATLLEELKLINSELDKLTQKSHMIDNAQDYMKSMELKATALAEQTKQDIAEDIAKAKQSVDGMKTSANIQANEIKEAAEKASLQMLDETKVKIAEMLTAAEENSQKSSSLLQNTEAKSAKALRATTLECNEMLINANRQAEEMKKQANQQFAEEKAKYDLFLRDVETQKTNLFIALDDIKSKIQAFHVTRLNDCHGSQAQSPSEVLRKKLSILNK